MFKFKEPEIYDAINLFTSSFNTMILFFWVNLKLSDSSLNKHSNMLTGAQVYILIYYVIFISISFFPRSLIDYSTQFTLYPDFKNLQSNYTMYYGHLIGIALNILNQVLLLNFYFMIIRNVILTKSTSSYLRKKK